MANFKVSYREDTALFQNLWVKSWLGIFIVAMIVAPFLLSRYQLSILNEMGIAVIGALGLNLLTGYTGQISLGHGAFVAIGAYTAGLLAGTLGVPFIVVLPVSGLIAALLSLIVGVPSLRLKGLISGPWNIGLWFHHRVYPLSLGPDQRRYRHGCPQDRNRKLFY